MQALFGAMRLLMTRAACKRHKTGSDLFKQRRRYRTVITGIAIDRPQIRSRPDKAIAFAEHDPRTLIIQAKTALGGSGNFDRFVNSLRWRVGDRQNPDNRRSVFQCRRDSQYENRTILVAFFPPLLELPVPQIRVSENPADLGLTRNHAIFRSVHDRDAQGLLPSRRLQQPRDHLRSAYRSIRRDAPVA